VGVAELAMHAARIGQLLGGDDSTVEQNVGDMVTGIPGLAEWLAG
jgi:hypothetical protein